MSPSVSSDADVTLAKYSATSAAFPGVTGVYRQISIIHNMLFVIVFYCLIKTVALELAVKSH